MSVCMLFILSRSCTARAKVLPLCLIKNKRLLFVQFISWKIFCYFFSPLFSLGSYDTPKCQKKEVKLLDNLKLWLFFLEPYFASAEYQKKPVYQKLLYFSCVDKAQLSI